MALFAGAATAFAAATTSLLDRAFRCRFAEFLDPRAAIRIVAHDDIGAENGLDILQMQRVHDRRGHARTDHHRQERGIEAAAVRQAEREVGGAAGGVDVEFFAQTAQQADELAACIVERRRPA